MARPRTLVSALLGALLLSASAAMAQESDWRGRNEVSYEYRGGSWLATAIISIAGWLQTRATDMIAIRRRTSVPAAHLTFNLTYIKLPGHSRWPYRGAPSN